MTKVDKHDDEMMNTFVKSIYAAAQSTAVDMKLCKNCSMMSLAGLIMRDYGERNRGDPEAMHIIVSYIMKNLGFTLEEIAAEELEEKCSETLH